jgi:hypothetical protein
MLRHKAEPRVGWVCRLGNKLPNSSGFWGRRSSGPPPTSRLYCVMNITNQEGSPATTSANAYPSCRHLFPSSARKQSRCFVSWLRSVLQDGQFPAIASRAKFGMENLFPTCVILMQASACQDPAEGVVNKKGPGRVRHPVIRAMATLSNSRMDDQFFGFFNPSAFLFWAGGDRSR